MTTASSFAARAVTALVSLITIPLALSYLGKEKYGLWAVVTSLVAWSSLFDLGILNSLVNSLSEANGRSCPEDAKRYVSTAFYSLIAISGTLAAILALSADWVPWSRLLAVRIAISQKTVMWTALAAMFCVLATMPLTIVRQIYAGYQKGYIGNIFRVVGSFTTLSALYVVIWTKGGLPALVFAFSGPNVLVGLINLAYLTRKEMPWLTPRPSLVCRRAFRRLAATSMPLFLFQVGALLVNESQMIVLAHVTNLKLVSEYAVLWRLVITFASLVELGTGAFIPAFREAHERGDVHWTRRAFRRMLILRMTIAASAGSGLILGGNFLLRNWLRRTDFHFPLSVWIAEAIFLVGTIWVSSFSDFLVIMDRIWIQVLLVLINGIISVALTVALAPRWGVLGAVAAIAFVTVCFWTWVIPTLVKPILVAKPVMIQPDADSSVML